MKCFKLENCYFALPYTRDWALTKREWGAVMWCHCSARVWTLRFEIRRCRECPTTSSAKQQLCPGSSDLVSKVVMAISFPLECEGLGRKKAEPNVTKSIPPAAGRLHLFLHRHRLWQALIQQKMYMSLFETASHFYGLPRTSRFIFTLSFLTCRFWRAKIQGSPTRQGRVMEEIV